MPDPETIGPYRLERVLGTGSFATVWLARDDVLERQVAVKILADNWSRDQEVRRRFLSEARVLLTVESPRIVRGFHLGEAATGQPYLVMAWADRGTLGDRIDERRREGRAFNATEVVGVATEVAYALTDVHGSGHLHRDVKPTNVLIRSSSTRRDIPGLAVDETIVLADFGLARGLDLSALTLVAGSPGYVAPEQAAGLVQLDRRADIYSLGRIMLELLTGDPGGRATTMAGAAAERIDVPQLLEVMRAEGVSEPSPRLVDLITRMVDESPDVRPGSADEVAGELNAIARSLAPAGSRGQQVPLAPPSAPPPGVAAGPAGDRPLTGTQLAAPPPPSRSRSFSLSDKRVLGAAGVLVAAFAAVVLAIALADGDEPEATDSGTSTSEMTSTGQVVTTGRVVPIQSGDANTTAAESTASEESLAAETTGVQSDETGPGQLAGQMAMPEGAVVDGAFENELDPDRQTGRSVLTPGEFAEALAEKNADWTGAPSDPDGEGNVEFDMTGPTRTANVRLMVDPNSALAEGAFTRYVIEYE